VIVSSAALRALMPYPPLRKSNDIFEKPTFVSRANAEPGVTGVNVLL